MTQFDAFRGNLPLKTPDSLQKFSVCAEAGTREFIALHVETTNDLFIVPSPTLTLEQARLMPRQQRLHRIAEILAKAVMIHEAKLAVMAPGGREVVGQPELTDEGRILDHLRVAPASPKEIRCLLKLSRSTFNRRIRDLMAEGKVAQSGNTRGVKYHLA